MLDRVKLKASTYGQDIVGSAAASSKDCKVDPQVISDLYRDYVMPLTKDVQVAYLLQRISHSTISVAGVEGSYPWMAAQSHFGSDNVDHFLETQSISSVFDDVCGNKTAYGIVPIEDSKLGMNKETQALLLNNSLKISAEIVLKRSFIIAAKDKARVKRGDISTVYVAPETEPRLLVHIEQCWPAARVVSVANVSDAASKAFADESTVAVTTTGAAAAHGLEQVDSTNALATSTWKPSLNGQSSETSFIRFVVISKGYPAATGKDKSCMSMDVKHEVGSLLSALEVWKKHGVNMCCLESIYRQDGGGYDFFVEILGHFDDANVKNAVDELQANICAIKHLGSFPLAKQNVLC